MIRRTLHRPVLTLVAVVLSGCDAAPVPQRVDTSLEMPDATTDSLTHDVDGAETDLEDTGPVDTQIAPNDADAGRDDSTPPDPCLDVPGACEHIGRTCREDILVDCGPGTDACAIETQFDCSIDGGQCVTDGAGARCTGGDPCFARPNACELADRTCDGDTLTVCAPDALGCLVETRTDCALDGFTCLSNAEPVVCSGGERCMNLPNSCTQARRSCDGDQLVVCASDASGCLVETVTDCAASGLMCRQVVGSITSCTTPCHAPACLGRAVNERFCSIGGLQVIECVDTDGDRCLEALVVEDCGADSCQTGVGGMPRCPTVCGNDALGRLSCSVSAVAGDTAAGSTRFEGGGCAAAEYAGQEAIFEFVDPLPATVTVTADWTEALDFDLFAYGDDRCDDQATCLAASAGVGAVGPEQITFEADGGELVLVALDVFTGDGLDGTSAFTITVDCERPTCGDGVVGPGEGCDDGGLGNGDGCSDACEVEPRHVCTGEPSECVAVVCGDGQVEPGVEACDDGNTAPGDGCAECLIEKNHVCEGEPSMCRLVECGDGFVDAAFEGCDDGGVLNGDGCNDACRVEPPYQCSGQPSFCTQSSGADCASAIALPIGTGQVFVFSTVGGVQAWSDYLGDCASPPVGVSAAGPERVFELTVPGSATVTARVTPVGGWDSVTLLATACPSPTSSCAMAADLAGAPEVVTWTNTQAKSAVVYLVVDGFGAGDAGEFTVELW